MEQQLDPVVVHGLTLLLPMIHVKPGAVPEEKLKLIRAAAAGFWSSDTGRFSFELFDPATLSQATVTVRAAGKFSGELRCHF